MILLFELHHTVIYEKCGGMPWMLLYFALTGAHSLITVLQAPMLVTSLGHDAIMGCELNVSPDEKLKNAPIMYWENSTPDKNERDKVFPPSGRYEGRVDRLDTDLYSPNKSILFKSVQWDDSGTYRCKHTITTESKGSERKLGGGTLLRVYDNMFFNTTSKNHNLLQCAVNVSWDPGFVLSISQGGFNLKIQKTGARAQAVPYVPLSETITLNSTEEYECQLHLNADLITKKTFFYKVTVVSKGGGGEKNVTVGRSDNFEPEPDVQVLLQPWLLYVALILVKLTVLLCVSTAMLASRCLSTSGCCGVSH